MEKLLFRSNVSIDYMQVGESGLLNRSVDYIVCIYTSIGAKIIEFYVTVECSIE